MRENWSSCSLQSAGHRGGHFPEPSLFFSFYPTSMRRRRNWPSTCVAFSPVTLTHREPKKPSTFRTKTSEAHPNVTPQKHRHSSRPVARVRPCLTLVAMHTHTHKRTKNSLKICRYLHNNLLFGKERKHYNSLHREQIPEESVIFFVSICFGSTHSSPSVRGTSQNDNRTSNPPLFVAYVGLQSPPFLGSYLAPSLPLTTQLFYLFQSHDFGGRRQ